MALFLQTKSYLLLFLLTILSSSSIASSLKTTTSFNPSSKPPIQNQINFCRTTPYPDVCTNSLKLSVSIEIGSNIISFLLQTLQDAISEAEKLTGLFSDAENPKNIVEKQRGSVQDCIDLHQITFSSLQKSVSKIQSGDSRNLADARTYLSAALTNKNTCLEGLESASGPLKPKLVNSVIAAHKQVSNTLSVLAKQINGKKGKKTGKNRRLLGFPTWVTGKSRRILDSSENDDDEYDPSEVLTVAADGTGNFTTITDAIGFSPNNSFDRTIIYVKEGVYNENIEIPSNKINIVLLGDGSDVTFITGNRSVADGWTTFRSATLAVSGEGFLARDLTIMNTAGPEKHQAAALRVNADSAAFYRCVFDGYQDTLYVHSFRQFYRECNVFGTIDYIFGNAAVVFQNSNVVSKMPMPGQFTVITAQSRDNPDESTGISFQNCSVLATDELTGKSNSVKSYLGRPWKGFSRTVFMESYIDQFIDPIGWSSWTSNQSKDDMTELYYGEYDNYGPGSVVDNRVNWTGYHVMDYYDAYNFTVSEFITGDEWLDSTSFPYDDSI